MATQQEIDSFSTFASQQVKGGAELSIDELFDLWQAQHLSPEELADSVATVKAALVDMENGDTGQPFEEFATEMRTKHKIPPSE